MIIEGVWVVEKKEEKKSPLSASLVSSPEEIEEEINLTESVLNEDDQFPKVVKKRGDVQEWLDAQYPLQSDKEQVKGINLFDGFLYKHWELTVDKLDLTSYLNLEELRISGDALQSPFTYLKLGVKPKLNFLGCSDNHLTSLDLTNCPKLGTIYCNKNQFTELNLSDLTELKELCCSNNYLTSTNFLINLPHPEKLVNLDLRNNNFFTSRLTIFSRFINLQELLIGNDDKEQIKSNIYNHFTGSLKPLRYLTRLQYLEISNTDLNGGVEYLPMSVKSITCSFEEKSKSQVKEIIWQLNFFSE